MAAKARAAQAEAAKTPADASPADAAKPETSAAVMRTGEDIGADLLQELALTVATTASRERLRKRVLVALVAAGVLLAGVAATGGVETARNMPLMLVGILCMAPVLPLALVWGVRNRALLNAAAANAAVDHSKLAAAVRLVEKKRLGPSTALAMVLRPIPPQGRVAGSG